MKLYLLVACVSQLHLTFMQSVMRLTLVVLMSQSALEGIIHTYCNTVN